MQEGDGVLPSALHEVSQDSRIYWATRASFSLRQVSDRVDESCEFLAPRAWHVCKVVGIVWSRCRWSKAVEA